jgi:hypothetical protein
MQTIGVNGANVYTEHGVGDMRVAFYTSFVRGLSANEIRDWVDKVRAEGAARGAEEEYERDLWLLAFQGRDVRGGKGERKVALELLSVLINDMCVAGRHVGKILLHGPGAAYMNVLPLVVEYGSWRDAFVLAQLCADLQDTILAFVARQFWNDHAALKQGSNRLSLLAKWLPREKASTFKDLYHALLKALFGEDNRATRRRYRLLVGQMNKTLDTVERRMCGGTWAEIKPSAVPGRCLTNNRAAFFNKKLKGDEQRSTEEDRVKCAENFAAHMAAVKAGTAKVNGAQTVYPHELIKKVQFSQEDSGEMEVLVAQWEAIKAKIAEGGHLGKVVPMCDFSGSMSGVPMDVSLGMGILVSELSHPAFRGSLMTFDSTPKWINFSEGSTLKQKVQQTYNQGFGLSTDFEAAFQMVLDRMVEHKVPVGEEPDDFVVFTDMGFDEASGSASLWLGHTPPRLGSAVVASEWETLVDKFQREFATASAQVHGAEAGGWKMPRLIIWNLRAEYKNYHAKADQKGVLTLSGWSPSTLRVITDGAPVTTPYEAMRELLDAQRYNRVREMLYSARLLDEGEVEAVTA